MSEGGGSHECPVVLVLREDYETATRGSRHRPGARAAGQGAYLILRHTASHKGGGQARGEHTHLVYRLHLPQDPAPKGSPQDQMNILPQASFILQIKNPEAAEPRSSPSSVPSRKAEAVFPKELQEHLGALRFAPADPPSFLDHQGCQFLLISASDDVASDLGSSVLEEMESECEMLAQEGEGESEGGGSSLLSMLEDSEKEHGKLVEPLFRETWA